ncbi:MAG: hypothetical protein H0W41_06705 [Chloroflexi bacterium]|nr:hypothetical protein [Chloroflexota bacterium]
MSGFFAYPEAITWLYATLTTPPIAGVIGVYEQSAPIGATTSDDTWIEYEPFAPGGDVAEVSEQRIWTEFAFLVRAVKRGRSTMDLKAIAMEMDTRLHRADGTTTDGQVISCVRSDERPDSWLEQGNEYRGLGGLYHLIVQPA